ncbi:hypothetical protein EXU57_14835 [Segetibacter sp. 3557_3]|uniref:hypothetical protein n=1 Tax=Segetibacter sp. 3557_3 TaxID=2547429 RepID=UPI001058B50D|nr:hypothetical protein [Segetibacter sp. 3557_3]TDH24613.1 hypothetical protein EXU57_14835 [Segetibacter sp. 3557_3]
MLRYYLTAITLLTSLTATFAQTLNRRTAGDFVLFTSNGAVGNTGRSHLTGDVGSNSGAITGFGNVNGVMHNIDGASAQAAADLLLAYYPVDTTTPGFFRAPLLGNGDTLRPVFMQLMEMQL